MDLAHPAMVHMGGTGMNDLPPEVVAQIMAKMDLFTRCTFSRTCRTMRDIAKTPGIRKLTDTQYYDMTLSGITKDAHDRTWHHLRRLKNETECLLLYCGDIFPGEPRMKLTSLSAFIDGRIFERASRKRNGLH